MSQEYQYSLDFCPDQKSYIEIPHNDLLDYTGDITISFWLCLRSWPNYWTDVISKFESDKRNEFCFRLKNANNGQWYYGTGDSAVPPVHFVPKEYINLNKWIHISLVRKVGAYGRLYINGNLQKHKNWADFSPPNKTQMPISIMGNSHRNSFVDGNISELIVSRYAQCIEVIRNNIEYNRQNDKYMQLIDPFKMACTGFKSIDSLEISPEINNVTLNKQNITTYRNQALNGFVDNEDIHNNHRMNFNLHVGSKKNLSSTIEFHKPNLGMEVTAYIEQGNKLGIHHVGRYQWAALALQERKPSKIVDIACGAGYGSMMLAQALPNTKVTGVDYDDRAVKDAKYTYHLKIASCVKKYLITAHLYGNRIINSTYKGGTFLCELFIPNSMRRI